MLKFVLLLTFYSPNHPADVFIIDYNLTGADCIAALTDYAAIEQHGGELSCEIDNGQPNK